MGIPEPGIVFRDNDELIANAMVRGTYDDALIRKITDAIFYSLALNLRVSKPNDPLTDMNLKFTSDKKVWRRTENLIVPIGQILSESDKKAIESYFYQYGFNNIRFADCKTYSLICFDLTDPQRLAGIAPDVLKLLYGENYKENIAQRKYMIRAYLDENGKIHTRNDSSLRVVNRAILHVDSNTGLPDVWCFPKTFYGYITVDQFNEQVNVSAEHEWYKLLVRPQYYCYAQPFTLTHISLFQVYVEKDDTLKVYHLAGGSGLKESFLDGKRLFKVHEDDNGKMTDFIFGINLGSVSHNDLKIASKMASLIQKGLLDDVINGTEEAKIPSL